MSDTLASWYESTARTRVSDLLDEGTFVEFLPPTERVTSPHLSLFDLPEAFDDGIVVGRGQLDGRDVFVAAQEGKFMGGAFGEVHGAKLVGLLRAARELRPSAVLILFDTGGVRLQEANAGETAIAEIMRAICEARAEGVPVVGVVGGRAGAFGGGGLIAGTCSRLIATEQGRIGVSGPEVIETNHGVEEFDSRDKALVWRVTGGKHRVLMGSADTFSEDDAQSIRGHVLEMIRSAPPFDLATMKAEQRRLGERLDAHGDADDAVDIWTALGVQTDVPDLNATDFAALLEQSGARHDAR